MEQIRIAQGYDHTFTLSSDLKIDEGEKSSKYFGNENMKQAATLYSPVSQILMEVWTDQPGVQLYTGEDGGCLLSIFIHLVFDR